MAAFQSHPWNLLDYVIEFLRLKNDSALAKILQCGAPTISKIRRQGLEVSPELLLRMHELTKIDIRTLRRLAGDLRPHTGASAVPVQGG